MEYQSIETPSIQEGKCNSVEERQRDDKGSCIGASSLYDFDLVAGTVTINVEDN